MIELDGSIGGGQVLRTALALSLYTGKSFKIKNIRASRPNPGLSYQHVSCVEAVQQFNNCKVKGLKMGSSELEFVPGEKFSKRVNVDIGTAGSITLLLQSLLLPVMLKLDRFTAVVKGGTDVSWSMPVDYFSNVFLSVLNRFGSFDFKLKKRGFYPKGGGEVKIIVKGKKGECLDLVDRGELVMVKGISYASFGLDNVAERQKKSVEILLNKIKVPIDVSVEYCETLSPGSGIVLWAIFSLEDDEVNVLKPIRVGADCLGEKGKRAEKVGEECAKKFLKEIEFPVDEHLADNLIPFLGVFGGRIKVSSISDHVKANIHVCEQFLGVKYVVKGNIIGVSLL